MLKSRCLGFVSGTPVCLLYDSRHVTSLCLEPFLLFFIAGGDGVGWILIITTLLQFRT